MREQRTIRIFISSPLDVRPERLKAEQIIRRLDSEFAYHFHVEAVLWERQPLVATHHFQDEHNIPAPHSTDIVVVILWSRLGVPLPEDRFRGAISGRQVTGTEWEFEDALAGARETGVPDLLLYRKRTRAIAELHDRKAVDEQLAQLDLVEAFVGRWFHSESRDSRRAASHSFETGAEFEEKLYDHLRELLERRAGAHVEGLEIRWHNAPFRGLLPFEYEHAPVFFGRTRARNELRELLTRQEATGSTFVLLLGASGSGKSSLVKAGLLPDLMLPGMVGRVALVRYALLRPSDRPNDLIGGLADAILSRTALPELAAQRYTAARLAALLRRAPEQIVVPIEQGLAEAAKAADLANIAESRLVLIIDQLEELFTLDAIDFGACDAFVASLGALSSTGSAWIVATMRSDFYGRLEQLPALARLAAAQACYRLLPPDEAELGQMIRQPAREAGVSFELDPHRGVGLDETIRAAAASDRRVMPLLSFVLDQLWRRRSPTGMLTFAAYNELGGLEGALGRRAEEVFTAQTRTVQATLPRVLRALVTLGVGDEVTIAARPAALDQFPANSAQRGLVEAFLAPEARLLVADEGEVGHPRVRITHEALLTHWPRARDWIAERRGDLRLEEQLEAEAARWSAADVGDQPSLLRQAGLPLSEAEDLRARRSDELSELARTFVEASTAAQAEQLEAERQRAEGEVALRRKAAEAEARRQRQEAQAARRIAARTRVGLVVALGLATVALGFAVLSYERTQEANRQRLLAETNFAAAKQAVDGLVIDVAQGLRNVAGMRAETVHAVLSTVQKTVDELVAAAPRNPALLFSSVAMLDDFTDIYLRMGRVNDATASAEQAVAVAHELVGSGKSDPVVLFFE